MKISRQWISDYVGIDRSDEEIEEALTLIGFEVEAVETVGVPPLENVVVGEVLSREQHPNADRLSVCSVAVGAEAEPLGIVCGAKNFEVGDRVPVALPGAVLPGGFKIKKSRLRGVPSAGMMCSARELNLGDDHSGLLILKERPALGTPVNDLFPEPDTVFDIEVTPNRPDCLSLIGIAREMAAWFRSDLSYPEIRHEVSDPEGDRPLLEGVDVLDEAACPRYCAWSIRGVQVCPSPEWMRRRLESVGLRAINNVVDCTNYVLLETGQPLHAFDRARIRGGRLRVRRAGEGETLTTLDDKERRLTGADLVIADAERPLVVAGVMGSVDAEVDGGTEDVVLEVAAFEPTGVRATSRRLGLSTDSSYRFERGTDPAGIEYAAARCIDLILETAGGRAAGVPIICGDVPGTVTEIAVTPQQIIERIGFEVDSDEIASAWERLDLEVLRPDAPDEPWTVRVPSFRADLERVADLTEEFLRMFGTDRIPPASVACRAVSVLPEAPEDHLASSARSHLVANGFVEAFNYSLVESDEALRWTANDAGDSLGLENPLASDQSHLRPSLLGGLLDVIRYNRGRSRKEFRFFECGRIFRADGDGVTECLAIAFAVAGAPEKQDWLEREGFDFFRARRLIEDLAGLAGIGWDPASMRPNTRSAVWAANRSAVSTPGSADTAEWGAFGRGYLEAHGIDDPVFGGELVLEPSRLGKASSRRATFRAPGQFPRSVRDIAVVCPQDTLAESVRSRVAALAAEGVSDFEVEEVRVFDVYQGGGLADGTKSVALSIAYVSAERTLADKEVGAAFDDLRRRIAAEEDFSVRE